MSKLRFGFGMIVLNGEEFIHQSIGSVYDFADQIWVVEGSTPAGRRMAREDGGSSDRTREVLHAFPDPAHKLHILPARFYKDKNEQSNAYMEAMDENPPDYVWQLDCDELYRPDDLEVVARLIEERGAWHVSLRALHFWHNLKTVGWGSWWSNPQYLYHRVNKFEKGWRYVAHRPPTILVKGKPIWEVAPVVTADELERAGIYLYHYSHVTDKQVRQKMMWYYEDGSWSGNWFEDVWKRWEREPARVEAEIGTHPVNVRNPRDPCGKGTTRAFKGEHPPAMQSYPLWRAEYGDPTVRPTSRVLHVFNHLSLGGGFVSPLHFIIRSNREPDQAHHIFTLDASARDQVDIPQDVTVFERAGRSMSECARWIANADYDIVHWHWWHAELLAMNALMDEMAGYGGHKRVVTCDVYPAAPEFTLGRREIEYADMIVFDGRDSAVCYPQIPESRKAFVVGSTRLEDYLVPRRRGRDGKFRMGRGSSLTPWKCPPDLIEMVAPILNAIPNAEFHIFGDGELMSRLRADIRRLGLRDRVFLRGWVRNFEEEVASLDLYVYHLPTRSFASSELNLQGAMAAGLPIVIMPSTGTKWMFEHGRDALVAENPVRAQEYCVRLATDAEEGVRLGRNARAKAFEEYGIEKMARGYLTHVYPVCRMRCVVNGPILNMERYGNGTAAVERWRRIYQTARRFGGRAYRVVERRLGRLYQDSRVFFGRLQYGLVRVEPNYFIRPMIKAQSIVVDIGTGWNADFSVCLLHKFGAQCYGFEPTRKHHASLDAVARSAGSRFKYFPYAVSHQAGMLQFYESTVNVSGSFFHDHVNVKRDPVTEYTVRAVTVEEIFDLIGVEHIDVLKMDVEGEEYAVFEKLNESVFGRIGQLVVEFHHNDVDRFTIADTEDIVRKIERAGFRAYTDDSINYLFFRR